MHAESKVTIVLWFLGLDGHVFVYLQPQIMSLFCKCMFLLFWYILGDEVESEQVIVIF